MCDVKMSFVYILVGPGLPNMVAQHLPCGSVYHMYCCVIHCKLKPSFFVNLAFYHVAFRERRIFNVVDYHAAYLLHVIDPALVYESVVRLLPSGSSEESSFIEYDVFIVYYTEDFCLKSGFPVFIEKKPRRIYAFHINCPFFFCLFFHMPRGNFFVEVCRNGYAKAFFLRNTFYEFRGYAS